MDVDVRRHDDDDDDERSTSVDRLLIEFIRIFSLNFEGKKYKDLLSSLFLKLSNWLSKIFEYLDRKLLKIAKKQKGKAASSQTSQSVEFYWWYHILTHSIMEN